MKTSIVFSILIASLMAHADIGFKRGNDRTAVLSQGDITVQCSGDAHNPPNTTYSRCQLEILSQGDYDYFIGPQRVQGDEVTLTATHSDGSSRSKTVGYDSSTGQSTKALNLWVYTLLQKPLLNAGDNKITYAISYKGKITARGEFLATVKDGGKKICRRHGYYSSMNPSECRFPQNFCSQFFQQNNFCL
ncbi:hypothetical protein [Bdellovibrio svalbardensis]|uniref:Secreted protein n=1 Tax=Bdellovibrio svalbardensis TaxID=2972972 RepID=A0ABT6DHH6_9BACT|nr:hypothetical protein [Bdellovibrio svalbardensis]MDG0815964.1 hypothetical protein [Bdellovibrio svalbardensis]